MSQPVDLLANRLYPSTGLIRSALNSPWKGLEVQGGRLRHWSSHLPGAASVSALFLRTKSEIFIAASSVDEGDTERFFLTILDSEVPQARSFRKSARPGIAKLDGHSVGIIPDSFTRSGPSRALVGLAKLSGSHGNQAILPASPIWIAFSCADDILFMYADDEIPLNVGLTRDQDVVDQLVRNLGPVAEIEIG
jgi:hypothetical protein